MNNLRDGLYSNTLILPGENKAQFDQLHHQYQSLYQPQNAGEQELVDQLAATKWRRLRVDLLEAGLLIEYCDAPASVLLAPYDRVSRIQARLQRLWLKLYQQLEEIKAARPQSGPPKEAEKSPLTADQTAAPPTASEQVGTAGPPLLSRSA